MAFPQSGFDAQQYPCMGDGFGSPQYAQFTPSFGNGEQFVNGPQFIPPTPNGEGFMPSPAGQGFVMAPNTNSFMPSPAGQGFMPSPNTNNFMPSPAGQGFVAAPNTNNFMPSPAGQGFVAAPNTNNFMQPSPAGQGFMPSPAGQGFMPSPNTNNFMQPSPAGQGFMPSPNTNSFMPSPAGQGFVIAPNTNSFMPSPAGQGFVAAPNTNNFMPPAEQFEMPTGDVLASSAEQGLPPKVLQWLSGKALAKLESVMAGDESEEDEDEEDAGSEEDEEELASEEAVNRYTGVLAGLHSSNVAEVAQQALQLPLDSDELATAIVARCGDAECALSCANLATLLVDRIPHGHRRDAHVASTDFIATLVQRIHIELADVDTDHPAEGVHGAVLLLGELYNRSLVGMHEVKELFGRLVFTEDRPHDHCASLACHLFLTAGPFLERNQVGRKLSDVMCARLRELKGINFSEATLFSLAQVTDLKLNKWVPRKEPKKAPKKEEKKEKPDQSEKVLLIGQLFTSGQVQTQVIKELFQQLLFTKEPKADLAQKLLAEVAPTLDASEQGGKLAELARLRLAELGRGCTRQAGTTRAFEFRRQVPAC